MTPCASPITLETLLDWWCDGLEADAVESHLLACDICSARADRLQQLTSALARSWRALVHQTCISGELIRRFDAAGISLEKIELGPDSIVPCASAPTADILVTTLRADLGSVHRLDLIAYASDDRPLLREPDILFDPAGAVHVTKLAELARSEPPGRIGLRLVSVEAAGDRTIGDYVLVHDAMQEP